ncbi:MAG: hypothetical protein V1659_03260 [Candidatus Woesearchaeota archaeon]
MKKKHMQKSQGKKSSRDKNIGMIDLELNKRLLSEISKETKRLISFLRIITIVIFFLMFLYFFQKTAKAGLAQGITVFLLILMVALFTWLLHHKNSRVFYGLKTANRIIMADILLFLAFLMLEPISGIASLISLYLAMFLLSATLQKIIFLLLFAGEHK